VFKSGFDAIKNRTSALSVRICPNSHAASALRRHCVLVFRYHVFPAVDRATLAHEQWQQLWTRSILLNQNFGMYTVRFLDEFNRSSVHAHKPNTHQPLNTPSSLSHVLSFAHEAHMYNREYTDFANKTTGYHCWQTELPFQFQPHFPFQQFSIKTVRREFLNEAFQI
jgi:hypothetical protein